MAKNQVNSNQIKDGVVLGRHIGVAEIDGTHLKDVAIESKHIALGAITDEHLTIDWAAKASTILQSKLVVDYVQAQAITVSAASTSALATAAITAPVATDATTKGVVVETGKNAVIVRKATDVTEPIRDTDGEEVKGRITHDGTDFTVAFHTVKAGVEVPFEFAEEASIVFQYPQRFDFESVSEMFGANEKFVDYGVDTSTRFDIIQLVADVFGDTYELTGDGIASNGSTLLSQIEAHTSSITAIEGSIATALDAANEALALAQTNELNVNTMQDVVNTQIADISGLKDSDVALANRIKTLEDAAPVDPGTGGVVVSLAAKRYDKKIVEEDLVDSAVVFTIVAAAGEEPAIGDYDVYLNGMLQMGGLHYEDATIEEEKVKSISFAPDALVVGDVVQVRWFA